MLDKIAGVVPISSPILHRLESESEKQPVLLAVHYYKAIPFCLQFWRSSQYEVIPFLSCLTSMKQQPRSPHLKFEFELWSLVIQTLHQRLAALYWEFKPCFNEPTSATSRMQTFKTCFLTRPLCSSFILLSGKTALPFGLNYELTMVEICRSLVGILIEWNDLASSEATRRGIYSTVYTISFYSKKRWFPPVSALTLNINIAGKKNGALAIVNKLLNISFSHCLYPY